MPVLSSLRGWAETWLPEDPAMMERDPDVVLGWLAQRVRTATPAGRACGPGVLALEHDRRYWLVLQDGTAPYGCVTDPLLDAAATCTCSAPSRRCWPWRAGDETGRTRSPTARSSRPVTRALCHRVPAWFEPDHACRRRPVTYSASAVIQSTIRSLSQYHGSSGLLFQYAMCWMNPRKMYGLITNSNTSELSSTNPGALRLQFRLHHIRSGAHRPVERLGHLLLGQVDIAIRTVGIVGPVGDLEQNVEERFVGREPIAVVRDDVHDHPRRHPGHRIDEVGDGLPRVQQREVHLADDAERQLEYRDPCRCVAGDVVGTARIDDLAGERTVVNGFRTT